MNLEDIASVCHVIKLRDGTIINLEGRIEEGFRVLQDATASMLTPETSPLGSTETFFDVANEKE